MRRMKWMLTVAALLAIGNAGAAEFTPYEGKNAVHEGTGGERKTVDGIDFWSNGDPPRRFQLLGFVTDKRHKTGLVGMARMAGLEGAIAKTAKEAGGDAVILVSSDAETVGHVGQAQTTGNATTTYGANSANTQGKAWTNSQTAAVQKQISRYAVVKYLPDEEKPTAAPTETPSAPPAN